MKPVEPSTIGDIQPLHGLTEISFRRLDLQMVVATHQRIGMNLKSEPGRKNAEQVEKMPIRALVRKDLPLLQAAVGDVIPAVFNVEPQWPGHGQENNPPADSCNMKCLDVTPAEPRMLVRLTVLNPLCLKPSFCLCDLCDLYVL